MYTFFGVGITIFIIGFIGINISLQYIQNKYIKLQLEVNKRQAEQMSYFIKSQINKGTPLDTIRNQFQEAIAGTQTDKGFMCIYDTEKQALICHPNEKVLGMKFNEQFQFQKIDDRKTVAVTDVYKQKLPIGGLFDQASMQTDIVYIIPIENTNWFLNAHENIDAISKEIKQLRTQYIIGSLLLGFLIAVAATFTARKISRKYEKEIEQKNVELIKSYNDLNVLHQQVKEQKDEIEMQHKFVQNQRDEITIQNKQITDSINYAKLIQKAILPSVKILNEKFDENFILFKPKDIVSGDFYWFSKIENHLIAVAADCTGHGVPGAFMSMLGVTLLNEIVNKNKILEPDKILNELRNQIKKSLSQSGDTRETKDGIDISLCIIDTLTFDCQFSGAYNSLYIIRQENNGNYEIDEVKADKMPIGSHPRDNISFTKNNISLKPNDRIYLFSDGYVSQFGGEKHEKFKKSRFQEILLKIQNMTFVQQKEILEQTLENWQGKLQQVDDILVVGIKI